MDLRSYGLPHVFRALAGYTVLAVVAGFFLAGVALPGVYAMGSVATSGVDVFNELPSEFALSPLAQQSVIKDAKGNQFANPYAENRIIVPLNKISPWMQKAQIAIEDARFYDHGGLDLRGFVRAAVATLRKTQVQGGSTLTQQYVKITLQENALQRGDEEAVKAATEKSLRRKVQELRYALDVEQNYSKKQILAGYLNLVNYGDQAYGVEAAALNYFGIHASKLNLGQSALLAGIVQQPTTNNPVANPKAAQARRDVVLDRMVALGMATPKQAADAKKIPVAKMLKVKKLGGTCQRSSQPYFCDYVLQYLAKSPAMAVLGKTPEERMKKVNTGGLTIRTTLDPDLQKYATERVREAIAPGNKSNLGGAASVVEPGTGKVLAMAQWSNYKDTQVNYNVDKKYGGAAYGYQFGSTAKMYALVTAIESGLTIHDSIYAPTAGPSARSAHEFKPSEMHDECSSIDPWPVRNDYTTGGRMTLAHATAQSINTAFAQLTISLGGCRVRDTMTRMGLHDAQGNPIDKAPSSIALGSGTVTPLTLANSYAVLAAKGKLCEPNPILSITDANGKALKLPKNDCKQVMDPQVAANVTKLLEGPLRNGTAAGVWNWERPAAGKTGTTENHNQGWFVGYTPQLSTAVWTGNVKPADKNGHLYSLNGKSFGIYGYRAQVFGGTISAPIWAKIMRYASRDLPVVQFPAASTQRLGKCEPLPSVVGRSVPEAQAIMKGAGFTAFKASSINSNYPRGTVAGTLPTGCAPKSLPIGLYVSLGPAPPPPPPTSATPPPSTAPPPTTAPAPRPRPTKTKTKVIG